MTPVRLAVNGCDVQALVEPRMQLADFLRNELGLTGTHLGCEQGVCGACTVMIDGVPQRSCIAYAVDCDGSEVVTIEGFDDDPVMAELREAFAAHHGLQCGFCTPGMLVTARDIVLRLGDIGERRIREELAGNLCRCTGYVGTVAAIHAVVAARNKADTTPLPLLVREVGEQRETGEGGHPETSPTALHATTSPAERERRQRCALASPKPSP